MFKSQKRKPKKASSKSGQAARWRELRYAEALLTAQIKFYRRQGIFSEDSDNRGRTQRVAELSRAYRLESYINKSDHRSVLRLYKMYDILE